MALAAFYFGFGGFVGVIYDDHSNLLKLGHPCIQALEMWDFWPSCLCLLPR